MRLAVPLRPEDVTASWLSQALSTPEATTVVASLTPEQLVGGAGTKLRVRVGYAENPRRLPEVMWVKGGWEAHSHVMQAMGVYLREAMFYGRFAGLVGVRAPTCYFVTQDEDGRAAMVLEDLGARGAELWACPEPRRSEDVRSLLDSLAPMHARFWQDPELTRMVPVPMDAIGPAAAWPRENGGERLRQVLAGPRGALMPSYARAPERIERAFWRMVETLDRTNGRCLLHGDPHPGNCFSDADGGAGLYDWQTISRGPWAYDVSYAVSTALSIEERRRSEKDLLAHYLAALAAAGVKSPPSFEEAWDDYRRYIAYALLIWPTNHTTHQAEENILALTERLGAAAADFRVFELWGA